MSLPPSPFSVSTSVPGKGIIKLSLLPPSKQVLTGLSYQYPLKLIAPDPHNAPNEQQDPVTVVFILTYGGGLVGGDTNRSPCAPSRSIEASASDSGKHKDIQISLKKCCQWTDAQRYCWERRSIMLPSRSHTAVRETVCTNNVKLFPWTQQPTAACVSWIGLAKVEERGEKVGLFTRGKVGMK